MSFSIYERGLWPIPWTICITSANEHKINKIHGVSKAVRYSRAVLVLCERNADLTAIEAAIERLSDEGQREEP